jgi:ATP-dependent Clp protease adaptor protein ClpS
MAAVTTLKAGLSKMSEKRNSEDNDGNSGTAVVTRPTIKAQEPKMYRVILHNDDYTPMDFVTLVLEKFFRKSHEDATRIMLDVHQKGFGICGVYPLEIAETKVALVSDAARGNEYPLKCTSEAD